LPTVALPIWHAECTAITKARMALHELDVIRGTDARAEVAAVAALIGPETCAQVVFSPPIYRSPRAVEEHGSNVSGARLPEALHRHAGQEAGQHLFHPFGQVVGRHEVVIVLVQCSPRHPRVLANESQSVAARHAHAHAAQRHIAAPGQPIQVARDGIAGPCALGAKDQGPAALAGGQLRDVGVQQRRGVARIDGKAQDQEVEPVQLPGRLLFQRAEDDLDGQVLQLAGQVVGYIVCVSRAAKVEEAGLHVLLTFAYSK
jgi:hypothetical protein